ncbi:MAG: acetyl-CoA hydrolase/transferase family protein [Alphaproteobacteria bacterium]|nr:acetyl-CoA hydrolase/transferase family protein [Alphaproteobacteria bacterium]
MARVVRPEELDLREFVRPGDQIIWGEAAGEPLTLTEALVAQRAGLGGVSVFFAAGFSDTLQPAHADHIRMVGIGGIGTMRRLTRAEVVEIVPCHVGQVLRYIESGAVRCDVAFVQVSPPGPDGRYSYGVTGDFIPMAAERARFVIAEVNDQVPYTFGDAMLDPERIDVLVPTSRPVVEVPSRIGAVERAIAGHAAAFIGDGATLQMGVGAIPDAVLQALRDRRDLGMHTGIVSDVLVDLVESGAMTNTRKPIDQGVSITGALAGTKRLYDFAHRNPAVGIRNSLYTHGDAVLGRIPNLVTVNSAIEVDLTGQVGAEDVAGAYLGGIGGQADYMRVGHRAPAGRAILALPATVKGGGGRIVSRLSGSVTTSRADADLIVTEFGAAELRAQPIRERARRLIAIAHPDHRERLEREAHALFKRGF